MNPSHPSRLIDVDPQTAALISAEERRQREKIILIPSESLTPAPVREALSSAFTSVYAEGYPRKAMMQCTPDELDDLDVQMAGYRRYADRRFYKGAELADVVESLAGRRAAECFATDEIPADRIFANVQALSGAAANLAVYDAFVEPGDTVMGMALTEGGHLTHGSEFNVTGKRYRIVSYAVDPKTGKLDYDEMLRLAKEHRPRMIIGGFTSYPWQPDWHKFREVADAVGAILLADVAHTAGMVIGGVYPNPIGIADVVTFTTHKTLCGPRGAVILSTEPAFAETIDASIFPGQQGGPHVNKFAALAVALKMAQQPAFAELQRRIVDNARHLATALEAEGLTLAYGGTDTHLLLVDLREIESRTGFVMMGEVASRILDLVGIVCNKNTLPGDTSAADAHGIRLGTPWATQRGMGEEEMKALAKIIARVLLGIRPFCYEGLTGDLSRGKLQLATLEEARRDLRALIARVDASVGPLPTQPDDDGSPWGIFRLHSGRIRSMLDELTPAPILSMSPGDALPTTLFDESGKSISDVVVAKVDEDEFLVLAPRARAASVESWLVGIADGYVLFDLDDLFRKVQGPATVEEITLDDVPEIVRGALDTRLDDASGPATIDEAQRLAPDRIVVDKPYFVAQAFLDTGAVAPRGGSFEESEPDGELRTTPIHADHKALGARLVPFAGWEMPVWYTSALDEHRAVREAAGLFDLGHMGVFLVEGEHATEFLNAVTSNYAGWLEDGQSHYAYLFDADGRVLDDVMVYRRARDRFLVVVNAANEAKDWEWLNGVNEGRYAIDRSFPGRSPGPRVAIHDLKADRGVIDLALQGPNSRKVLEQILDTDGRRAIAALDRTEFCELTAEGHQLLVARTGYTGESLGYEIYVGGAASVWLWQQLIAHGKAFGLLPCGLAARDSLRTEAGLPLYGHELGGEHGVDPFEAGFASYVKLHKPFFVGRDACVAAYCSPKRTIVRFRTEVGARRVQDGASLLDRNGSMIGTVTSCVSLGEHQIGLALVERPNLPPGQSVSFLNRPTGKAAEKALANLEPGDRIPLAIRGRVLPRLRMKGGALQSEAD